MARSHKNKIQLMQRIATGVLLLLGAAGGYFWWAGPKAKYEATMVEKQKQKADLIRVNERTRKAIVSLGSSGIQEQIVVYEKQGRFLREMMPPEDTISRLMTQVTNATRKYSVQISEFGRVPRTEVGGFAANGFALKLTGKYHDIGSVLAELLGASRVTHISKVVVKALAPAGAKAQGAAKDLRSINANSGDGKPWEVEISFEIVELGISKVPTQEELKAKAAADAAQKAAAAARKKRQNATDTTKKN